MGRNHLITLAGLLTLAIAGCASEETPPVVTSPEPSPVAASPAPAVSPQAGQAPGTQPLIAQRPAPAAPVAGLIPSTNAQEREKQVRTETRTSKSGDPFSALPPALPEPTTANRPVPNVAQLPQNRPGAAPGSPRRNTGNTGNTGNGGSPAVVAGIPPQRAIGESPTVPKPEQAEEGAIGTYIPPVTPPRPTAAAAEQIEVTGVIAIGTTPQAIVKSPDEPSSRYVGVGQRLSNGRVLVKRIEMNPGGEPVVVFEQNGIEISKSVGQRSAPATTGVS